MGTITKALTLLTHFSSGRGEIGLANFVRLSGGDKATVRRHLVELEKNGFLEQHPEARGYRLGPAVLRLASVREKHLPIRSTIKPIVSQINTYMIYFVASNREKHKIAFTKFFFRNAFGNSCYI